MENKNKWVNYLIQIVILKTYVKKVYLKIKIETEKKINKFRFKKIIIQKQPKLQKII